MLAASIVIRTLNENINIMGLRNIQGQSLHDNIIQVAYNNLDKTNHDIYINPGQQKNTHINNYYPDIIITDKNSKAPKFIIEVETPDSINFNETTQWKSYSTLGGLFYLLVPLNLKNQAELLCRQQGIKARFGTYHIENNQIVISYE